MGTSALPTTPQQVWEPRPHLPSFLSQAERVPGSERAGRAVSGRAGPVLHELPGKLVSLGPRFSASGWGAVSEGPWSREEVVWDHRPWG